MYIFATKWCIVGYLSNALWNLWDGSNGLRILQGIIQHQPVTLSCNRWPFSSQNDCLVQRLHYLYLVFHCNFKIFWYTTPTYAKSIYRIVHLWTSSHRIFFIYTHTHEYTKGKHKILRCIYVTYHQTVGIINLSNWTCSCVAVSHNMLRSFQRQL